MSKKTYLWLSLKPSNFLQNWIQTTKLVYKYLKSASLMPNYASVMFIIISDIFVLESNTANKIKHPIFCIWSCKYFKCATYISSRRFDSNGSGSKLAHKFRSAKWNLVITIKTY